MRRLDADGHTVETKGLVLDEHRERSAEADRRIKALTDKLDHLDEAFLFAKSIDQSTYGRQRDKVRQELALAQIDCHTEATEEIDVEGLLAFAERILPRAADLWCNRRSIKNNAFRRFFFPKESRSTEIGSIEPP